MLAQQGIIVSNRRGGNQARPAPSARKSPPAPLPFRREFEDIHMNVEARLAELIGEAAGRLHTARSRNDQVATDLRLWVREACERADAGLLGLQRALVAQADAHAATIMPGFTHMQPAQPVTFGHHCLAYVEMLARDRGRFADAARRMNESPLGRRRSPARPSRSTATMTAKALGFDRPMRNSLDAVSARDFALEFLAACGDRGHASVAARRRDRAVGLAAFGFIRCRDAFTTGSSIMPQKRNPDAAELVRAKAGRILGALSGCSR